MILFTLIVPCLFFHYLVKGNTYGLNLLCFIYNFKWSCIFSVLGPRHPRCLKESGSYVFNSIFFILIRIFSNSLESWNSTKWGPFFVDLLFCKLVALEDWRYLMCVCVYSTWALMFWSLKNQSSWNDLPITLHKNC